MSNPKEKIESTYIDYPVIYDTYIKTCKKFYKKFQQKVEYSYKNSIPKLSYFTHLTYLHIP